MRASPPAQDLRIVVGRVTGVIFLIAAALLAAGLCVARPPADNPIPNIFDPHSTPADSILQLSSFVLIITAVIFVVVCYLLTYAILKFRSRPSDSPNEPA